MPPTRSAHSHISLNNHGPRSLYRRPNRTRSRQVQLLHLDAGRDECYEHRPNAPNCPLPSPRIHCLAHISSYVAVHIPSLALKLTRRVAQFSDPSLRRFNLVVMDLMLHGYTEGQVPAVYGQKEVAKDVAAFMVRAPPSAVCTPSNPHAIGCIETARCCYRRS